MTKSWHPRLQLNLKKSEFIPLKIWFDKNKKNPEFKHLVLKAYRDWTAVVHIDNKIVKKSPDGGAKEADCQNQKSRQNTAGFQRLVPNAKTNQGCLGGSWWDLGNIGLANYSQLASHRRQVSHRRPRWCPAISNKGWISLLWHDDWDLGVRAASLEVSTRFLVWERRCCSQVHQR